MAKRSTTLEAILRHMSHANAAAAARDMVDGFTKSDLADASPRTSQACRSDFNEPEVIRLVAARLAKHLWGISTPIVGERAQLDFLAQPDANALEFDAYSTAFAQNMASESLTDRVREWVHDPCHTRALLV